MKTIKIILILAVLAFSALLCNGQVYFGYDAAGNRISRSITLQKSTQQEEDAVQPEQKEMKDKAGDSDVLVYPNPVRDEITVKIPGLSESENAVIIIYGQGGNLLYRNDKAGSICVISFSGYMAGIYYMTIKIGEDYTEWKVVKE